MPVDETPENGLGGSELNLFPLFTEGLASVPAGQTIEQRKKVL